VSLRRKTWLQKLRKLAVVSGVVLVALAAAAYKNVIPGGPELVDAYEALKNRGRLIAFRREAGSVAPGTVVFLGSSSVAIFPLDVYYPGRPWLNRGLGVESLVDLLERLDASLPVARPAGIVIFGGMNDLRAEAADPAVIVDRMRRVIDAIAARFPGVAMAILEVTPVCTQTEHDRGRLHALNDGLSEVARAKGLAFVRTNRPPLVDGEGRLVPELARPDGKHLGLVGYGVLATWILEDGGAATAPLAPP